MFLYRLNNDYANKIDLTPDILTPDISCQLLLIWLLSPNFEVEWVGN